MTELITTQPAGVAAILAALGFILTSFARLVLALREPIAPISAAVVDAIRAWTRRTIEERDCAPRLAKLESDNAALKRLLAAAAQENEGLRTMLERAGFDVSDIPIAVVEARDDEPTGDQRLPHGIKPRERKGTKPS